MPKPYAFTNADDVQKRIDEYFEYADTKDKPYTMSGLALYLDVDRTTLVNYGGEGIGREYNYSKIDPEELKKIIKSIQRAKKTVQNYAEENLYRKQGQVNGVIFALKNNHSWKEQTEVTTVAKEEGPDLSNLTEEQLQDLINKISNKLENK